MRRKRQLRKRDIKRKNRKIILLSCIILSIFTIGYGAFQTNISLNITGKIKEYEIGHEWKYDYTGTYQTFKVPQNGTYKIELWGAAGGRQYSYNGYGGYVSGKIILNESTKLYVYVGEKGKQSQEVTFNGGGGAAQGYDDVAIYPERTIHTGESGGGATDIRLTNGEWNNFLSLKSRIIVAGAGGGSFEYTSGNINSTYFVGEHSNSGGLEGYNGSSWHTLPNLLGKGGTQITGGVAGIPYNSEGEVQNGGFGYGGSTSSWSGDEPASGGGSGYYGGGAGAGMEGNNKGGNSGGNGGGGSSFISGHDGCDAISELSTENNIIHTGQSVHYSGLYFIETIMIDGAGYKWTDYKLEDLGVVGMPTHSGIGNMIGNEGNGYAKITLIAKNNN